MGCGAFFAFFVRDPLRDGIATRARSSALWIESCLEAASTTMGGGLSGIFPQSISKIDLQRGAMGSSQPNDFVTFPLEDVPVVNARRG